MNTRRIVYLHGFASGPGSSKARYFRGLLQDAGFRVDVPDLAEGRFEQLTLSGQLAVIARTAGDDRVSLIGSSMGGYLAALYAARNPAVERLVLMAPAFGFARRWAQSMGAENVEKWRRLGGIDVYHYTEGRNMRLGAQLLDDAVGYEDFPDVRQPCLVFHGTRDDVVPASASEQFARGRQNVRLHLVNSGHELTDVLDYMGERALPFLEER